MENQMQTIKAQEKRIFCTLIIYWIYAFIHFFIALYFFLTIYEEGLYLPFILIFIFIFIASILLSLNRKRQGFLLYIISLVISLIFEAGVVVILTFIYLITLPKNGGNYYVLLICIIIFLVELIPTILLIFNICYYRRLKNIVEIPQNSNNIDNNNNRLLDNQNNEL